MNPFEWRINDIERGVNEAKRRLYEIDTLHSDVSRLEHSLREARTEIDGLRSEIQTIFERCQRIEEENT